MRELPLRHGRVDLDRGVVRRDGIEVVLTGLEARLLRALVARPVEDLERDLLYALVWDYVPKGPSRSLDIAVARLRDKIEVDPKRPDHIITVHRTGYRFVPAEPAPAHPDSPGPADGALLDVLLDLGEPAFDKAVGGDRIARAAVDGVADDLRRLALHERRAEQAARAALLAGWALGARGHHRSKVDLLEAVLRRVEGLDPGRRVGLALELGFGLNALGRVDEAVSWLEMAVDDALAANLEEPEARARTTLGQIHHRRGDPAEALRHLEAAARLAATPKVHGNALVQLAVLRAAQGQRALARTTIAEALDLLDGGDPRTHSRALLMAGMVRDDDAAEARQAFAAAETLALSRGVETVAATARLNLVLLDLDEGRREGARATLESLGARFKASDFPMNQGLAAFYLAVLDAADGDLEAALGRLRLATPLMTPDPQHRAVARSFTAWVLARQGNLRAARGALQDGGLATTDPEIADANAVVRAEVHRLLGEPAAPVEPTATLGRWLAREMASARAGR